MTIDRQRPMGRPGRSGLTLLELVLVLVILTALGAMVIPMTEGIGEEARQTVTRSVLRDLSETLGRYHGDMDRIFIFDGVALPGMPFPDPSRVAQHGRDPNHPQLTFLFVNPLTFEDGLAGTLDTDRTYSPTTRRGWNGSYCKHNGGRFLPQVDPETQPEGLHASFFPEGTSRYAVPGDPAMLDGWGRPVVLQVPVFNEDGWPLEARWRHARLVSAGPSGVIHTPPDVLMPAVGDRGDDEVFFLFVPDTGVSP